MTAGRAGRGPPRPAAAGRPRGAPAAGGGAGPALAAVGGHDPVPQALDLAEAGVLAQRVAHHPGV
ncbi:hypothetical protein, partial [Streptomyces sp. NPDC059552]|uniref:hypothetical protein n=1 Tax=Streptomyces sp. NPDC059552 TaxID=3346862 RepID=UPI0036C0015B